LSSLFLDIIKVDDDLRNQLQNFSAAVDDTIIEIKNNSLDRHFDTSPIAIITGPDIGAKGSPVQFNGSASTTPNNSTILNMNGI